MWLQKGNDGVLWTLYWFIKYCLYLCKIRHFKLYLHFLLSYVPFFKVNKSYINSNLPLIGNLACLLKCVSIFMRIVTGLLSCSYKFNSIQVMGDS